MHGGEARADDGGGAAHERLGGVVDAALVEAEAVGARLRIRSLHGGALQVGPRHRDRRRPGGVRAREAAAGDAARQDPRRGRRGA